MEGNNNDYFYDYVRLDILKNDENTGKQYPTPLILRLTDNINSVYISRKNGKYSTIMINDAIVIKRVDNDKYKIGDIITFISSDSNYKGLTITHRVVDKLAVGEKNSIYTTKGDNNRVIDPATVSTRDIYGKVLFKIPKIGYMQDFFSKPCYN